ncbi:hypothetical protein D7V80_11355 [Corallococcus sp. CA054B]|uniref:hypothetical protein n=1 Tax=Corallococcus sp. CA054B TaxID=2316734 RepID=UPI000EA0BE68|nr:hypothetical protein [Corallococcus sp. CA054B]RKG68736.1 hypothetical protein D7V80_11355 [Corallococcus sp. CA054B]
MIGTRWLWVGCTLVVMGCGGVGPEVRIAGTVEVFQKSEQDFIDMRREVVRARQALMNAQEAADARLRAEVDQRIAAYKVAGDEKRQKVFAELLAATNTAAEVSDALDKQAEQHRMLLAEADTKVAIRQDKLNEVVSKLSALGQEQSIAEQAKFMADYLSKTQGEFKKLKEDAEAALAQERQQTEALKDASAPLTQSR